MPNVTKPGMGTVTLKDITAEEFMQLVLAVRQRIEALEEAKKQQDTQSPSTYLLRDIDAARILMDKILEA